MAPIKNITAGIMVLIVLAVLAKLIFSSKPPMQLITYNAYKQTTTTQEGKIFKSKCFYFYVMYYGEKTEDDMQRYITPFMHYFTHELMEATPEIREDCREGRIDSKKIKPILHDFMINKCLEYRCYLVLVNDKSIIPDLIELHNQDNNIYQDQFAKEIVGYIPVIVRDNEFTFLRTNFFS